MPPILLIEQTLRPPSITVPMSTYMSVEITAALPMIWPELSRSATRLRAVSGMSFHLTAHPWSELLVIGKPPKQLLSIHCLPVRGLDNKLLIRASALNEEVPVDCRTQPFADRFKFLAASRGTKQNPTFRLG